MFVAESCTGVAEGHYGDTEPGMAITDTEVLPFSCAGSRVPARTTREVYAASLAPTTRLSRLAVLFRARQEVTHLGSSIRFRSTGSTG